MFLGFCQKPARQLPGGYSAQRAGSVDWFKNSIDNSIIKRYYNVVDKKHQKVLDAIFDKPIRSTIPWKDIEALFVALEAEVTEGRGSRVRVELNGVRAVFHRPHPEKETDKGALRSVQRFLIEAGVVYDGI